MVGRMRRRRTRGRKAGLITFPADFSGGREVKITAPPAHCSRPPLLPPDLLKEGLGCLVLSLCPLGY